MARWTEKEFQEYRDSQSKQNIRDKSGKPNTPKKIIRRKNTARKVMGPGPDGKQHWYDSKFEADYARKLVGMKKAGEIIAWFPHIVFMLLEKDEVPGERPVKYTCDFVVINNLDPIQKRAWLKRMEMYLDRDCKFFLGISNPLAGVEIHETKAEWLRKARPDWPLRRKWFKLKYGIPVKEIIQK